MNFKRMTLLLVGTAVLSGCAEFNSIYRASKIPAAGGKVTTVDAKQRHLISSNRNSNIRFCAEAAPDVFSAFATSSAAKGDKSGGQFAFSSTETAAAIGRTQTINVIRESMYRTCERFISGAIDEDQLIVQAARDQRAMVAILAIEQLTGASRTQASIISPAATSASISNNKKALEFAERAETDKNAAQKAAEKSQNEYKDIGGDETCGSDVVKPEDEGKLKEYNSCKDLQKKRDNDKKLAELANKRLADATEAVKDSAATASSATDGGLSNIGTPEAPKRISDIVAVAKSVENIVQNSASDEPLMFCISYLGTTDPEKRKAVLTPGNLITNSCLDIMTVRATGDEERLGNVNAKQKFIDLNKSARLIRENYNKFKYRLLGKIENTNNDEFTNKLKIFEEAINDKSLSIRCRDKNDCVNYLKNERNNPFSIDYENSSTKLNTALDKW